MNGVKLCVHSENRKPRTDENCIECWSWRTIGQLVEYGTRGDTAQRSIFLIVGLKTLTLAEPVDVLYHWSVVLAAMELNSFLVPEMPL